MSASIKMIENQKTKDIIRSGYAKIAIGERGSCCGPNASCCGSSDPANLAQTLGYDQASLEGLPEGANMGLSCGNPVAIAALLEGQTVLDLGSGGGFDVFQAGKQVKESGRVIGVDMTPEMLSAARHNIEQYRKLTGLDNVEFRLGEIEHLPVPDASVDVVISNCVINLSTDKEQVWREIFRVLKPGGKVVVSDIALLKPLPPEAVQAATAMVGCVAGAIEVEETRHILNRTGFCRIQLTPKSEYIQEMMACSGSLHQEISESLPPEAHIGDYLVSLDIEAIK
ncbi:arsenite methyltransferase [Deltaproteobacteria bacterium OttesenSCG-928-M10]|nr:arsenite methyltransferase [Deltaproteobacteria bacterium OttesenSCG-928-M10]